MTSDEIRQQFLEYFRSKDHLHLPSASLVPVNDPSTLLISAGMHPLKPYFRGAETPPHHRLTTCQKCFRTVDIDIIGTTYRHLTFFEMLGNFSFGDYFKQGAVEFAWDFSLNGFGFEPEQIWVTVFEGDEALGLGPDEEAIAAWESVGVPRSRIVLLPRSENFWQAGPTGPCGPCSELYLDRGLEFGAEDDLPGGENERFLEYWNLVFMQYEQEPEGVLEPLPAQNIDTGLGLNRLAAIMQGTTSVFETDQLKPLMTLGEELSGRSYGKDPESDRALRLLADHTRGMSFLVADGVVPSNEDRGYVLRRLMRRAILNARQIGIEEQGFLVRYADVVRETMGGAYPELLEQRAAVDRWLASEEESFGRTIEQGTKLLDDIITRAKDAGAEGIGAENAFLLHDTYGFPFDLTLELAAEQGLGVDAQGFEALMDEQRARSRKVGGAAARDDSREQIRSFAEAADFVTTFTGYESTEQTTQVGALHAENGRLLVKLVESPFYPAGGGQVSDAGYVECESGDCRARVAEVVRVGDDQALVLEVERGELHPEERVVARVDAQARRPTECNHTATHLLHAALREHLGDHVRQAGSYVGPDKLRFDFTHGSGLSAEEVAAVEDRVNEMILANDPVRAITTTLDEARSLGAMALFGEKYGDVVRMVEVGDGSWSRELCGGTHVRRTAEIGVFKILSESSSAANVRRIEALTGPAAVELLRRHDQLLAAAAAALKVPVERAAEAAAETVKKRRELEKAASRPAAAEDFAADMVNEVNGLRFIILVKPDTDPKLLAEQASRWADKLGGAAAVFIASAAQDKVAMVAAATAGAIERGVKAGELVKVAAPIVGGGGGGRDNLAQAGGRAPERLDQALDAVRAELQRLAA